MANSVAQTELRALVVENDASNRELLARVLRLHDCKADTAIGAHHGYQLVTQSVEPYDLLVTDLNMEPVDGVELLRQIGALPPQRHPRAMIVLSGYLADYYAKLAALHLSLELFQKPLHLPSLIAILNRLRSPS
jgi:CheY-like chemotaxis protein